MIIGSDFLANSTGCTVDELKTVETLRDVDRGNPSSATSSPTPSNAVMGYTKSLSRRTILHTFCCEVLGFLEEENGIGTITPKVLLSPVLNY